MDRMDPLPGSSSFALLLRRYRKAAGFTQEELAERAHLSARAVSDLERGLKHTPRRDTVTLLAEALELSPPDRAAFEAARRSTPDRPVTIDSPRREGATLPSGTVTFLFTDVVGSTTLWDRAPEAMRAAISRHDRLLTDAIARHDGMQVKERGEGDSIFAVFTDAAAALAAACEAQIALSTAEWALPDPLHVRMGLHTGQAAPEGIGYYGMTVNRAARIRGLAHGGQILLSSATAEMAQHTLPAELTLKALGEHILPGIERPELVFQALHPLLRERFPPLAGALGPRHNLPEPLTSFVGREREQTELRTLLDDTRLVTVTGIGGGGKTRLALHVAAARVGEYHDGVWLVELATLTDETLVAQQIAAALGLRGEPGRPIVATLIDYLAERTVLLILDNCEHLARACAALAVPLLRGCPRVQILATSREELGVPGEGCYRLSALAAPDPRSLPPEAELASYESVRLFLERARSRRANFAITARNAEAIARICARLDGIPLAIELAAAHAGGMPVEQIAGRLGDGLGTPSESGHAAAPRQTALSAALDWSYDLLNPTEQTVFRRLSVFAGGWTIEAAEAVCRDDALGDSIVLAALTSLVRKSLIELHDGQAEDRYRMLETVRHYGQERLRVSDELIACHDRHLTWCLTLVHGAEAGLIGPDQRLWLQRLAREHDNLREALAWSRRTAGRQAEGLRLATGLWRFWVMRGHLGEGRHWLDSVLREAPEDHVTSSVRASALRAAGRLALEQGDLAPAQAALEESLALARNLGDRAGAAASLHFLGHAAKRAATFAAARALYQESQAIYQELGDARGIATSMQGLGDLAQAQGDYAGARVFYEQGLRLADQLGDTSNAAWTIYQLALVALGEGEQATARTLLLECLGMFRDLEEMPGSASTLVHLGWLAIDAGDLGKAHTQLVEGMRLFQQLGAADGVADISDALAALLAASGRRETAASLLSAADARRGRQGLPRADREQARVQALAGALEGDLGAARFAATGTLGRTLGFERALATALASLDEWASTDD
jgi:predicted ATPase/class 3 adenylate cyclase